MFDWGLFGKVESVREERFFGLVGAGRGISCSGMLFCYK